MTYPHCSPATHIAAKQWLCNTARRHVHLTNTAVQQGLPAAALPPFLATAQPFGGAKCGLRALRQLLREQHPGLRWEAVWTRIADILTACLFAAQVLTLAAAVHVLRVL
jgi:hypothetical protein